MPSATSSMLEGALLTAGSAPSTLLLTPLNQGPTAQAHAVKCKPRQGVDQHPRPWGSVDRIAFNSQDGLLALAHSTSKLSLVAFPESSSPAAEGQEASRPALEIVQQFATTSTLKASNKTLSLDFLPSGLLHSTTAGHLSLHTLSSSSSPVAPAPLRRRLPANLTCFAPLSDTSFAYAGQEVDLSVWDTERAFASSGADKVEEKTTTVEGGKKRKKGVQLLPGETWRAQNLPNDYLSLRVPIHHLSLCPSSSNPTTQIYTGTYSGQVRLYDTRASRRPVQIHHVLKPFPNTGVGSLTVQSSDANAVWFAEDGRGQGRVGRMDGRTGRVLYFHSESSATSNNLFTTTLSNDSTLIANLSADQTLSTYLSPETPEDEKKTPQKGALVVRSLGATGRSVVHLPSKLSGPLLPVVEAPVKEDGSDSEGEDDDEEDVEGVWSKMAELKDGEQVELDSDSDVSEQEVQVEGETDDDDEVDSWDDESEEEEKKKPAKGKKQQAKKGGAGKKARR